MIDSVLGVLGRAGAALIKSMLVLGDGETLEASGVADLLALSLNADLNATVAGVLRLVAEVRVELGLGAVETIDLELGDELTTEAGPALELFVEMPGGLVGTAGSIGRAGPVLSLRVVETIIGEVGAGSSGGAVGTVVTFGEVEVGLGVSGGIDEAREVSENVGEEAIELRVVLNLLDGGDLLDDVTNGGGLHVEGEVLLSEGFVETGTGTDSGGDIVDNGVLDGLVGDLSNKGGLGGSSDGDVVSLVDFDDILSGIFHDLLDFLGGLRRVALLRDDLSGLILSRFHDLLDEVLLGPLVLLDLDDLNVGVVVGDGLEARLNLGDNSSDLLLRGSNIDVVVLDGELEVVTAGEADLTVSDLLVNVGLEVAKDDNVGGSGGSSELVSAQLDADSEGGGGEARCSKSSHDDDFWFLFWE